MDNFKSQYGQDILLNGLFRDKSDGIFVDIGAYDGIELSNTYLLEQRGWRGLCIEPSPETFKKLVKNRRCMCSNVAVWAETGYLKFTLNKTMDFMSGVKDFMLESNQNYLTKGEHEFDEVAVPCVNINELLEQYGLQEIDVISIDTEGSEHIIIDTLDLDRFKINCFVIENNRGFNLVLNKLLQNGYGLVATMGQDNIYMKNLSKISPFHNFTQINWNYFDGTFGEHINIKKETTKEE